mmetsp:Transcript_13128/g.36929  ORF Transcript_13128/g.36929 Transcript_13128/m.36929 type:complete len:80 (-) Transcript_13128:142-381(-)
MVIFSSASCGRSCADASGKDPPLACGLREIIQWKSVETDFLGSTKFIVFSQFFLRFAVLMESIVVGRVLNFLEDAFQHS